LARIDDSDEVWINGKRIGGLSMMWNEPRYYEIDPSILTKGINSIVIRAIDYGGGGGVHGLAENMFLLNGTEKIDLSGDWKYKLELFYFAGNAVNLQPSRLYNQMIHPILGLQIAGVLWYQGESNASQANFAKAYSKQLPFLIEDWRSKWGIGDFPFYIVQLTGFMPFTEDANQDELWPIIRDAQWQTAKKIGKCEMVVTYDLGDAADIHPRNKRDIAYRLAKVALNKQYGKELNYSGPVYTSHSINDNKIIIEFIHAEAGFKTSDGNRPSGFAIRSENGKYKWAKAEIQGSKVVLWNPEIENPKHVRFAWKNNPTNANLTNSTGIPAAPFSTEVSE
jgi:sialate O-acetylesterase